MFVEIKCPDCKKNLVLDICVYDRDTWKTINNSRVGVKTVENKENWLREEAYRIRLDLEGLDDRPEFLERYLLNKLSKFGIEGVLTYDVLKKAIKIDK